MFLQTDPKMPQVFYKCFTNVSPVPVLQNGVSVGGADAPGGRGAGHQRSLSAGRFVMAKAAATGGKPDTHEMKHRVFSVTVM